jgi:hypothetical protein
MGKNLVMPKTGYKYWQLEQSVSPNAGFWLGFLDYWSEGNWGWVDGTTGWFGGPDGVGYTFTNWETGNPDNSGGDQDFAYIWEGHNYKWDDGSSWFSKYYICE